MKARFDPESRHTRYQAEFQARRKKSSEGWADFADDLKALADKAYPTLQDEAREQLAINAFLQQLSPPEVAFSVKQKRPNTLDDAVAATIELESYVSPPPANVSTTQPEMAVTDDSQLKQLTRAVEHLTEQVEHLRNAGARPPRRSSRQLVHSLENAGGADNTDTWQGTAQTGKLTPSGAADRPPEGDFSQVYSPEHITYTSPVSLLSGFRLTASLNGVGVSMLVDTGSAVSLLRLDVWKRIMAQNPGSLEPCPALRLLGAGGEPLSVHGRAYTTLLLGTKRFPLNMVVVDPLTSPAILGLDFLMDQQANIVFQTAPCNSRRKDASLL